MRKPDEFYPSSAPRCEMHTFLCTSTQLEEALRNEDIFWGAPLSRGEYVCFSDWVSSACCVTPFCKALQPRVFQSQQALRKERNAISQRIFAAVWHRGGCRWSCRFSRKLSATRLTEGNAWLMSIRSCFRVFLEYPPGGVQSDELVKFAVVRHLAQNSSARKIFLLRAYGMEGRTNAVCTAPKLGASVHEIDWCDDALI